MLSLAMLRGIFEMLSTALETDAPIHRELSNLPKREGLRGPEVRSDLQVFLIVEGHTPVLRRLGRQPGSGLILSYDALRHVEADRQREKSVGEKDPPIPTQPEHLVPGVRHGVATVLVAPLKGRRERVGGR